MMIPSLVSRIREIEGELRAVGVQSLSVFGSVARGDDRPDSDIDVSVIVDANSGFSLLDLMKVKNLLADYVKRDVDIVTEPVRNSRLQENIEKDRLVAF